MKIKKGDRVKMEYTGKLNNGTPFEKSERGKPLEFTVGEGQVIPGIEQAVEGMAVGEQKTVTIIAAEAFGQRDTSLVSRIDRRTLPPEFTPEKGMMVTLHLHSGEVIPATIMEVGDADIIVDLNHPLAGKDLQFDIRIVAAEPSAVAVTM
jgi:peptidylprolyl isomerase